MLKRYLISLLIMPVLLPSWLLADGLLIPSDENYPKDFLRNRLTHIVLTIDGLVAETVVTQEFINESYDTVDGVWNFPLPANARAFRFRMWYKDTILVAKLKVQQQGTNPGTGSGGVAADVNRYIGSNGLRIPIKGILPGSIQRVELSYIQFCEYDRGKATYTYPLFSDDFITYPLEHLEMVIKVESSAAISGWSLSHFQDVETLVDQPDRLEVRAVKAKAYLNSDIIFSYTGANTELGLDFFAETTDSLGYHFGMVIRPPDTLAADSVLPMRAVFLISRSLQYDYEYQFEQCKSAIGRFLDDLDTSHVFNIIAYASDTESWQPMPVAGTPLNIAEARSYLNDLTLGAGADLDGGIYASLQQFTDETYNNTLILLTDGTGSFSPRDIAVVNPYMTGIFPIVFWEKGDIPRLTMLADLNYGFITAIRPDDNFIEKTDRFFHRVKQPMMKNVILEYGKDDIRNLVRAQIPALYAGSYTYITGRYDFPSIAPFSIAGIGAGGATVYDFMLDFTPDTTRNPMMTYIWAKDQIDALEREILVYGVQDDLKQEMIEISLAYGIRCMYTAYVLEYTEDPPLLGDDLSDSPQIPIRSSLAGNYPNPFNSSTVINVLLTSEANLGVTKLIKIYDLRGHLVRIIDIRHLSSGLQAVRFDGIDAFGRALPSGVYFIVLQVGNSYDFMRIILLR